MPVGFPRPPPQKKMVRLRATPVLVNSSKPKGNFPQVEGLNPTSEPQEWISMWVWSQKSRDFQGTIGWSLLVHLPGRFKFGKSQLLSQTREEIPRAFVRSDLHLIRVICGKGFFGGHQIRWNFMSTNLYLRRLLPLRASLHTPYGHTTIGLV